MKNDNNSICYCRRCNGIIHVIQGDDTLYTLSQKYNVCLEDIMYANPSVNVYNLQDGDKVCIPFTAVPLPAGMNPSDSMESNNNFGQNNFGQNNFGQNVQTRENFFEM